MKITKSLVTKISLAVSGIGSFCLSYNAANSFIYSILIGLLFVLVPVAISSLLRFIRKPLFHYSIWTITLLFVGLFVYSRATLSSNRGSVEPEYFLSAMKHFRNKAGLFANYSSAACILVRNKAQDISKNYVVKNAYRVGSKEIENYYIGKVLLDSNYNVIKEFYNVQAISDTVLLQSEFGNLLFPIMMYKQVEDLH